MLTRAMTIADGEALDAKSDAETPGMNEEGFRIFYERTARSLWAYLARVSGDPAVADDLLQECYCRLLSATNAPQDETHRRNYLFRIATNLLRDHWRHIRTTSSTSADAVEVPASDRATETFQLRSDLGRALAQLKPRERELLWLAYAEGASHREIAERSGMKETSIRPLLFRARKKLLRLLGKTGAVRNARKTEL